MPTFAYLTKFRIDLQKFSSGQELLMAWQAEAQAALEGIDAGTFQLWKDAAEPVVYAIINIEADNTAQAAWKLYEGALSLPMGAAGQFSLEEAKAVVPYRDWADTLVNA